jgi:hypothetical protein
MAHLANERAIETAEFSVLPWKACAVMLNYKIASKGVKKSFWVPVTQQAFHGREMAHL